MSKVFKGLDYQGRHPEAAEAATEVGADDTSAAAEGGWIVWAVLYGLIAWLAIATVWLTVEGLTK